MSEQARTVAERLWRFVDDTPDDAPDGPLPVPEPWIAILDAYAAEILEAAAQEVEKFREGPNLATIGGIVAAIRAKAICGNAR